MLLNFCHRKNAITLKSYDGILYFLNHKIIFVTRKDQVVMLRIFFAVMLLLFCCITNTSANDYQVSYLSVEHGLSHNEVTSIVQDKYGFMWFGTRGGLNRYDGYEFKQFKPSATDSFSISNPSIESLYCNYEQDVYIGLKSGGPSKYVLSEQKFKPLELLQSYGVKRVLSFYEDSKGNTWIGTWNEGVFCIKNDTIIQHENAVQVRDIVETEDGTIWIASTSGLKYIREDVGQIDSFGGGSITAISLDQENDCLWVLGWAQELRKINYKTFEYHEFVNEHDRNALKFSILNDSNGKLWIGTWGSGLYSFDKAAEKFEKVNIIPQFATAALVDFNVVRVIYEDKVGDIWLGTKAGIVKLSSKNNFKQLTIVDNSARMKAHIGSVIVDKNGRTWLGTHGNGLFYSDDKENIKKVLSRNEKITGNPDNWKVRALNLDGENRLWVSLERGVFTISEDKLGNPYLLPVNKFFDDNEINQVKKVHQLFFDNEQLWIATQQNGIFLFKRQSSKYRLIKQFIGGNAKGQLGDSRVTAIQKDLSGEMWFATYKGLYKINSVDSTFLSLSDLGVSSTMACDIVLCLEHDKKGNLWFGTPCSLNKVELNASDKPTLKSFTKSDGLSDDYINGVVEDSDGQIWFSSNAGISCFNPTNEQVLNFDKADGLGDISYSEGACFSEPDGIIYFGGYTSLTYFNSKEIRPNTYNPPLVISHFAILNKEVKVGDEKDKLNNNINDLNELVLSHEEMEFSFQLASLDFKAPNKNQYAYRLLGNNTNWVDLGNQRKISFNNLKPDTYQLQLRGTNSNGIWSDDIKVIDVTVLPAPWKNAYAIAAYVLFIILVFLVIIRTVKRQERLQNVIEMERVQSKQKAEINDYKLRFFTNISHEFRTPLTLILAPVKELMDKEFSDIKPGFFNDRITMIGQSTKRLYSLVNQLLDLRKMESGKITLNVFELNLKDLVNECCIPFSQLAKSQSLDFKLRYAANSTAVFVDVERISVVLTNLLSNAFKHVNDNGKITLDVTDDETFYRIAITNEGKAIPKAELEHLFERFYQVRGNTTIGSSGIGLQLVKEFTELHSGKVSVSSSEGEPVVFTVFLKKGKEHFSDEELNNQAVYKLETADFKPIVSKVSINKGSKGSTVLIVEDNTEVRHYLQQLIGEYYSVIEAVDGFDGFEKAIQHQPDLVLSDVMMSRMDGYELCEKIKTNDIISDIPVVLLTAKGSDREQLFGVQKGADLYIKKPFVPDLLLEEIKQLIATRKLLKVRYADKVMLEADKEEISSAEAVFLKQAVKAVEKYMSEHEFTPDTLANELAMSSSTFYRKIKKATNLTPAGFIKSIRLKKAAHLLKDTDLTISEIVERTGYVDGRSFRTNFKEQFGDSPTDYRNKAE